MNISTKIIIAILLLMSLTASAEVRLPRLVSNGMVLQRDTDLKIWGWASPKESVTVTFLNRIYKTKANSEGEWSVSLPPQQAGGPYEMEINHITIKDILFGDVWLCSGQSNMELPIYRTLDLYKDEVEKADNAEIRYFRMPIHYNFNDEELDYQGGEWKPVTPENIMQFSATAYFFAKNLYDIYRIPIGLINTAVGGSPAEAWISSSTLKKYPIYEAETNKYAAKGFIEATQKQEKEKTDEWNDLMLKTDKGLGYWHKDNIDLSDWSNFYLPGSWKDKNIDIENSVIWFRKEFEIKQKEAEESAVLRLGYIIDSDSTFVNGVFVGTTGYQYPPRIYKIPKGVLKTGKNTVTVRIVTNQEGGFKEDKPYKVILSDRTIDLTGEWKYNIGCKMPSFPTTTFFQYKPMGLYNGMIAPVSNYKIKGVIWYQGESNIGRAKEYTSLFQDLINDWRTQRSETDLPFVFAQLPEINKPVKYPRESEVAELREAQRAALKLPRTGMAVTLGFGEWNDIHPLNKKGVAYRLSLEAQRVAYGETHIVSTGPQIENYRIEGKNIFLTFTSVGSGLYSNLVLNGFTIAGSDDKYVWAEAVVLSENTVKVWSDKVQHPVYVRYAWADNPEGANLKNKEELPASPFKIGD